jgi:DNA-binding NtrC family response regulator
VIEPENLPVEFTTVTPGLSVGSFILPTTGLDLDNLEASLIKQALELTKGNRSKSARLLGLSRDTLLYRMQKHGCATH